MPFCGQVLDGDAAVIHFNSAFQQVQLGHLQRFFGKINAGHLGAAGGHGLGEDAAAAADIEHHLPVQRRDAVNMFKPQRIDFVQGPEFAVAIPPAVGEFAKLVELGRVGIDAHALPMRWRQLSARC
jgi:hypothetical protein